MRTGEMSKGFFRKSISNSFVLFVLIFKKEDLHQSLNSFTKGLWSGSSLLSKDTITESSTNFKMLRPTCWQRHLFVYKINNKGERTQPWGNPVGEMRVSPFTLTRCGRSVKKSVCQATRPGSMKWESLNISAKINGWMQLKADEKSMNRRQAKVLTPLRWVKTKFSRVLTASSTPLPDL